MICKSSVLRQLLDDVELHVFLLESDVLVALLMLFLFFGIILGEHVIIEYGLKKWKRIILKE